jgi:hypothetical protein
MNNILMGSFSESIKKEIENIQKLIFPLAKKTSKYMLWTFPLIGIAVLNLIYLLFFSPKENDVYVMMFIYAMLGAIGFALLKETKINKKEIQNIGVTYITDRINKSSVLTDGRKNKYIQLVSESPVTAMEHFVKFLQEEERVKKLSFFNSQNIKNL